MSLKILHLNYNDKKGGAAIAVNRIHECLKKVGVISKVLVAKKTDDDDDFIGPSSTLSEIKYKIFEALNRKIFKLEKKIDYDSNSYNLLPNNIIKYINTLDFDLINLHWIGNNFLRIKLLDNSNKPVLGSKIKLYDKGDIQLFETSNVRGIYSTSEDFIHFGLGNKNKIDSLIITWPNSLKTKLYNIDANQVLKINSNSAKDFKKIKNNTKLFFEESRTKINYTHIENSFDDFEKQVLLPHKLSQLGPALAVADVNGDDLEDVFIGSASGKTSKLFLQSFNGEFIESQNDIWNRHKVLEDIDAIFLDFDNDGDNDLYVVSGGNEFSPNSSTYLDRIYINDGKGNFEFKRNLLPDVYESGSVVRPYDFDNDGDLDLFIGSRMVPWNYPEPATSYLLVNNNGSYVKYNDANNSLTELGLVTDAVWSDYDNDGDKDLFVVGEWMPLTLIKNHNGVLKKEKLNDSCDERRGWWYSIESADFNNDGQEDLVLGNLGKNYKYQANPEEPFEVFYDDFDDNGSKDIVLAYYNYGIQFPLRGFSCSSQQIPELKSKIQKYDLFASLDVKDVYGEVNLDNALRLHANSFKSVVLINKNSTYDSVDLPYQAQLSSINDIIVEDYNNDGNIDLLVAGNLFTSEVETPRNDASNGLMLIGNGDGTFMPKARKESGFFAPSDAKKLNLIKIKNEQGVIVGNNNDLIQYFKRIK